MSLLRRCFWNCIGRPLFRFSPHPTYGFRRFLLKLAGMRQGTNVRFRRSVDIDRPWNISIGDLTMIGDEVLMRATAPIRIGARLESGVVIGARAMVEGRIPGWQIATGEPAVARRERVLNMGS